MQSSDPLDLVPVIEEDGSPLELTEMEAIELKNLLDANGIDAVISGSEMMPNLPYRLMVASGKAAEAGRVIAEARAAGPEGAEEAEQEGEAASGGSSAS